MSLPRQAGMEVRKRWKWAEEAVEENGGTVGVPHGVSQALFPQRHCRAAIVPDSFIWLLLEA